MARRPAIQRVLELLSVFPIRTQYRIADLVSFFIARSQNNISRQTKRNIELCFPNLSGEKQNELIRQAIKHTSYSFIELAAVWCWPIDKILAQIKTASISPEFDQSTQGRIVIAPHLGSWELLNIWLSQYTRLISLYKPQDDSDIDRFMSASRCRSGALLVPINTAGLRQLYKGLKRGYTVMILPDQKPQRDKSGIDAMLFGHIASTTTLVQSICSKLPCDVFIGAVYRESKTGTFGLAINTLDYTQLALGEQESVQYLNDQIEHLIRAHVEQYQWSYRRFPRSVYM